jgi:hypothetical protein
MYDELKTAPEIEKAVQRMIDTTAQHLHLPRERIFPLSAQKALVGRIKGDKAMVEKSGILALETYLAEQIVPMKRQILCKAVVNEIGGMMASSRALVGKKQQANQTEVTELNGLVGKSRDVVTKLWAKITAEKNAYNSALAEYKVNHNQFSAKKTALLDLLNSQKLDQALAKSAQSIEDSWTTITLQRGMNSLVKDLNEDFQAVFLASEDIKKLMQGVYNTFIQKFGFQKMTLPSLDLDPQRTKLQLLVMQTEQFVKDPVNVVVKEKHFVVKNFYNTLVREARKCYNDAKHQSERWIAAVVLPLEVQMKDHKNQLQSRLDNLAKINEKTTSINEQMAILKAAEADLAKQRNMIEGLIGRVAQYATRVDAEESPAPLATPEQDVPAQLYKTGAMQAFDASKPDSVAKPVSPAAVSKPAAPKQPEAPLMSDDMLGSFVKRPPAAPPAPAAKPFDPNSTQVLPQGADQTQKLPPGADRTQKMPGVDQTQKMPPGAENTQRIDRGPEMTQPIPNVPRAPDLPRVFESDRTMQVKKLDQNFKPESTQRMDLNPPTVPLPDKPGDPNPESTQRLDDSIWRLEEAKRILKGVKEKS